MATVIVATAAKVQQVEDDSIVSMDINESGHLIITNGAGDDIDVGAVAGDTPDASTTVKGIVELATEAETATGTDVNRAVTPQALKAQLDLKQGLDSDLTAIASLSATNDDIIQRKGGAWVNRSLAQLAEDLNPAAAPQTLTDGATINTDAALGDHFRVTLGGNRTLAAPSNPEDGKKILFEFIQDGTGSRTITLATGSSGTFLLGADIPSVILSTGANKRDFMGAIYISAISRWCVIAFIKGY